MRSRDMTSRDMTSRAMTSRDMKSGDRHRSSFPHLNCCRYLVDNTVVRQQVGQETTAYGVRLFQ